MSSATHSPTTETFYLQISRRWQIIGSHKFRLTLIEMSLFSSLISIELSDLDEPRIVGYRTKFFG